MDNLMIWECPTCGWVNRGHKDYCTACLLTDSENKEANLARVNLALRGEVLMERDRVRKIA